MDLTDLPEEWTVWNEEHEGRVILAFRPDVFDSQAFPAPCMPTIYVTNGSRRQRPGVSRIETDTWYATLLLEPEVEGPTEAFDSRDAAVDGAVDVARRFAAGDVDYRDLYQVPREEYLDELDELTEANA